MQINMPKIIRDGVRVRTALAGLVSTVAMVSGLVAMDVQQGAAVALDVSNVSASLSVPASATGPFTATGTVTNTGTVLQVAGSKVTISTTGATMGGLPVGCVPASGTAVCTAGPLAPGQAQSFSVTVSPSTSVTSVATRAQTTAAQPDLNAPTNPIDDDVTGTTDVIYSLDADLTSEPSTVKWGRDTLLSATVTNNGIAQSGVTLQIATGGTVDLMDDPLRPGCSVDADNPGNVTCSNITLGHGETWQVDVATTTPGTGSAMHSTATVFGVNGSGDTASWDTGTTADAAALVLDGQSLPFENRYLSMLFEVPLGSTRGIFLTLREATEASMPPGTMCGARPCDLHAAEMLFPNDGPWSANDPLNPLIVHLTYKIKQGCNGSGAPSGCLPLYVIPSGSTTAKQMPLCPTYSVGNALPAHMSDVDATCLNHIARDVRGFVTYQVAQLRDVVIPIVSSIKG